MQGDLFWSSIGCNKYLQLCEAMDNSLIVNRVWVVKIVRCITAALRHPTAKMQPAGTEAQDQFILRECLSRLLSSDRVKCIAGNVREELGLTGYICQLLWCQAPVEGILAEHNHALHKHAEHTSYISHYTSHTLQPRPSLHGCTDDSETEVAQRVVGLMHLIM